MSGVPIASKPEILTPNFPLNNPIPQTLTREPQTHGNFEEPVWQPLFDSFNLNMEPIRHLKSPHGTTMGS